MRPSITRRRSLALQAELKKIKHRFDQLYVDKLDGKLSEKFWLEKSSEWQLEQDRL